MSRGVYLRRAGPADLAALAELEALASLDPWNEAQIAVEVARPAPDAALVLAGRSGVRAWCAVRVVAGELQLMSLAVHPDERRRGLGRFLLGAALQAAARAGANRALLEVRASNTAARALYSLFGFVPLGVRTQYYRAPPEDALVLVRDVPGEVLPVREVRSILN